MLKKKKPYNAELYKNLMLFPQNARLRLSKLILLAQLQGYKIKPAI